MVRRPNNSKNWTPWKGILIPTAALPRRQPPIETAYTIIAIGLEDLTHQQLGIEEIAARLQRYNQRAVLTFLSQVDAVLENDGPIDTEVQAALVQSLLPEPLAHAALRQLGVGRERRVVFSNQSVWILIKLALLRSMSDGGDLIDENAVRELAVLLLAAADQIDKEIQLSGRPEEVEWELTRHLIRSQMLHVHEHIGTLVLRIWKLLVDLPSRPDVRSSPRHFDLGQLLSRHAGIDAATYMTVGFATLAHYLKISFIDSRVAEISPTMEPARHFQSTRIGRNETDRVFALLALPADRYAKAIREEHARTGSLAFSFSTMRDRPMIQYGGEFLPLSQHFLKAKFTDGLFWMLRDFSRRDGVDEAVRSFLGDLFELYVQDILASAYRSASGQLLLSRVHYDVTYQVRKGKLMRTADAVLNYADRLIFLEVTASRPRLEPTQTMGLREAFEEDTERIILQNARQLHRNILHLLKGFYTLPGVDPALVRRIYPVVVTLQSVPEGDLVWKKYEQALASWQLLSSEVLGRDIARLQLITAEDLEMTHDIIVQGKSLPDMLDHKERQFRNLPFKNFLLTTVPETVLAQRERRNHELELIFDQMTGRIGIE